MSDHVSALDATFLELEELDEAAHMHIGGALVFEPPAGGGPPSLDDLIKHLRVRLRALPRYRQRLSRPHTGGLSWPEWERDPDFDLAHHVHRAALPAPGGHGELMDFLGDYWSHRLDRRRPLWEVVLVEGLQAGRWALVTKTHHAMVDGGGSVGVGSIMLDASPEAQTADVPPLPRSPAPRERSLLTRTLRATAGMTLHPDRLKALLTRSRAMAELMIRDELLAAPQTSLNEPIGTMRRFEVVRVPLSDLRRIKAALGGTVNDVALAAASGGLRHMLAERGEEPPEEGMRAMVPVNLRTNGDGSLGNHITSLFVNLPVAEASPLKRYARTVERAEQLKAGNLGAGGEMLIELTSHVPPVLHSALARSLYASRLFNITITNVPGAPQPLYLLGSRMVEVSGLVPLAADHDVGIAILSYDGHVTLGLIADRDAVPDLDALRDGIEASLDELRVLAGAPAAVLANDAHVPAV